MARSPSAFCRATQVLHKPTLSYEQLLDRVAQLETLFGCDDKTVTLMIDRFDLTSTQGRVAGMLYRRSQVTREQIYIAMYGAMPDVDQPKPKIIDIHMSHVRKALVKHGIEIKNDQGIGWRLDVVNKNRMKEVLDDYAFELTQLIPPDISKHKEIEQLITSLVSIIRHVENK